MVTAGINTQTEKNDERAIKHIKKLEDIISEMKTAAASRNKAKIIILDFNFHHSIIEYEQNELYLSLYNTLKSFLYHEIKKNQMSYGNLQMIPAEHGKLIEAMKTGNQTEALMVFQGHISNIKYKLR